ncbi:hypothetical protein PMM47T1_12958 [Pseudomonas sp. M47T1]|uniref:hypothetical protein n=1 Tax=unclassified Pseudomonas TaxID=196821 RepID=UPI00026078A6|nr:hypothetical protein [Pseudomonas sp. M47T1]EIK96202.1 hypothetical protein PMM47T1_12958 [Pseudomonas sp. M47T1]
MTSTTSRSRLPQAWRTLLALPLLLAGCSSAPAGSKCYAEAVPSRGEGGLAWANSMNSARKKSLDDCALYASRSGGTPSTCKVVLAKCK